MQDPSYTYVVVRADLPPSQQAVQACHACLEAGKHFPWQGDHPHLALLAVPDEGSLRRWLKYVQGHNLQTTPWYEPDLEGSLTAFAVPGVSTRRDRRVFSGLPTLKLASPTTKETKMITFQSRWGYHPCSYEFYLKLKRLNLLAQKCLSQASAWKRWDRKEPQNRCRFIGGKDGWEAPRGDTVGQRKRDIPKEHRLYEPMPEPPYPPGEVMALIDTITSDYRNARTPVVQAQVKPLVMSEQKVDTLLRLLEVPGLVPV